MYTGLIARRYATALADFAAANGEEERVREEVGELIKLYQADHSLRMELTSPVLNEATKVALVERLLEQPPCGSFDGFIRLVVRHRREQYLLFMLNSFVSVYKQRHHITDAVLTTAQPVDAAVVERIRAFAVERTHGTVLIRQEVRPELIGGFVFRLDDVLVDASLATQLGRVRRQFGLKPNRIV